MITQNGPKETNNDPQPATNNPDEVMDTPKEVEESGDAKTEQDFPGYPHYPAEEDILNPGNDAGRVDIDVENLTRSHTIPSDHIKSIEGAPETEPDFTLADEDETDDIEMVPGTEADVTDEDLLILGPKDEDMDLDEDEELRARGWTPRTGKDLDVPEAEANNEDEAIDEDEENSYYSLGGDEMQSLEENNDQNNF